MIVPLAIKRAVSAVTGARRATGPATAFPRGTWWPLLLLVAAILAFQLATIRAGHVWGDDHALYILHARALLEGSGYANTGFVWHPDNAFYSTRIYPPGFPLLLVPLVAAFGLNLFAMKALVVVFLAGAAALLGVMVRRDLPGAWSLAPVALLGFQPFLTDFKDNILPDLPFTFFVLLTLLLLTRLLEKRPAGWQGIALGLLAGVLVWYATAVRTIGITLLGALALALVFRRRWPSPAVLVTAAVALLLIGAQRELLPPASGYATQMATAVEQVGVAHFLPEPAKLVRQAGETFLLWEGPPRPLRNALGVLVLLAAATGFLLRLRRPGLPEAFVIAYGGAIFLFPVIELRYALPIVPFLLYYLVLALYRTTLRFRAAGLVVSAAFAVCLTAIYGVQLARADYGPIANGSVGPAAEELYRAVRACTAPGDRVLFARARALTLYTRRPALTVPRPRFPLPELLDGQSVAYVVAARGDRIDRVAQDPAARLRPVFAGSTFILYRHLPPGQDQAGPTPTCDPGL